MPRITRRRKKRKSARSGTNVECDGIQFRSKLEVHCYLALKEAGLFEKYEQESFQLLESSQMSNRCYERQSNGKGEFKLRSSAIRGISYTPDFTGKDFIIEVKGHANDAFPLRWKLFKDHLGTLGDTRNIFKPQSQGDIKAMIEVIKSLRDE